MPDDGAKRRIGYIFAVARAADKTPVLDSRAGRKIATATDRWEDKLIGCRHDRHK
jgi:hypothetical protein